jgi:hypothetical protein
MSLNLTLSIYAFDVYVICSFIFIVDNVTAYAICTGYFVTMVPNPQNRANHNWATQIISKACWFFLTNVNNDL